MIETPDYFVQKAGHNEALCDRDGDTAGAQIEKLVLVRLAESRSVGATNVVGVPCSVSKKTAKPSRF
jgi:hypothetical protein